MSAVEKGLGGWGFAQGGRVKALTWSTRAVGEGNSVRMTEGPFVHVRSDSE